MDQMCYDFLQEFFKLHDIKRKKVLEIGSLLIDGQERLNLRNLMDSSNTFIGLDMREGPGVDVVANSHELPFDDREFDVIINFNTLEHDDDPFKSMKEMKRCLKIEGGVLLTATPCYFYIHDYPSDYFRYTNEGVKLLGRDFVFKEVVCYGHPYFPQEIFGIFSNRKLEMNMETFVNNYSKEILPKIHMDLRNFLRYIMVDMTKKVFRG